jgi:hypothetical protein
MEIAAFIDAVVSHAMTTGYFTAVNAHEPKSKPGTGIHCAVWVQSVVPIEELSGLNRTAGRVLMNVRLYTPMLQDPMDAIDPNMVEALDKLFDAYHGDFTLDGLINHVDLLGAYGVPLTAQAGYVEQSNTLYRIITMELPLIVNDLWEQTA